MEQPFVGQIQIYAFSFPPRNWAFCQGQLLPISQNTALFSLLGTTFGGNGQTTFALPNLESRVPIGVGQGPGLSQYDTGEETGAERVTLLATEMPTHTHPIDLSSYTGTLQGSNSPGNQRDAQGHVPAVESVTAIYSNATPVATMAATALQLSGAVGVASTGGGGPHENRQPFLVLNYCIALAGVFPARN
jgi:microcystin-dependent protein